jgi:hypothetical protein
VPELGGDEGVVALERRLPVDPLADGISIANVMEVA